ncbi:hypothetical protein TNCV_2696871 [Trichonephila clavipes]|nr:hypothetical protein TNCV_2696871 [Trichonephila clavipes]
MTCLPLLPDQHRYRGCLRLLPRCRLAGWMESLLQAEAVRRNNVSHSVVQQLCKQLKDYVPRRPVPHQQRVKTPV